MTPPTADGYVRVPTAILNRRDLTPADKLVFAVVADRIGENGRCWPGVRRLAADCGLGTGTAAAAVKRLEAAGLIHREPGRGQGTTNYRLARSESERSESERSESERRARNLSATRSESERNLSQVNLSPVTKPKRRAAPKADHWELVEQAMTADTLKTDRFRAAWAEWCQYRRESRKPLTAATIKRQVRDLEALGHDEALASIEQSIRHGWAGLFAPRSERGGTDRRPPPRGTPKLTEGIKVRILNP